MALAAIVIVVLGAFALQEAATTGLRSAAVLALVAAQGPILLGQFFNALRLRLILWRSRLPVRIALQSSVLAGGMNALLPGRLSELIKVTFIREHAQVRTAHGLACLISERLLDAVSLCALLLLLVPRLPGNMAAPIGSILVLLLVALLLTPHFPRLITRLADRLPSPVLAVSLRSLGEASDTRQSFTLLAGQLLLSAAVWATSILAVYIYLRVAAGTASLHDAILVLVAGTVGGLVAVLPAAVGTFHAATTAALMHVGYGLQEALALSLGLHLLQYLTLAPAAIFLVVRHRTGLGSILANANQALRAWRGGGASGV